MLSPFGKLKTALYRCNTNDMTITLTHDTSSFSLEVKGGNDKNHPMVLNAILDRLRSEKYSIDLENAKNLAPYQRVTGSKISFGRKATDITRSPERAEIIRIMNIIADYPMERLVAEDGIKKRDIATEQERTAEAFREEATTPFTMRESQRSPGDLVEG